MKTIIAGSRKYQDAWMVEAAITSSGFKDKITEVVCGGARGPDQLGAAWAMKNGIKTTMFPALWDKHGKSAGYIRNLEMVNYADALIAVWDEESRGTAHTIEQALKNGLKVFVYKPEKVVETNDESK